MILTDKCQALVLHRFPGNGYEILHRRLYHENTESIFGAPYKNNLTILSQAWTIPPEMYHHQDNPATFE